MILTKFIIYSDIHHDHYTNGITLDDTIAVEDEISEFARANRIKEVFFLGDLYRATNPKQTVIKAAEAAWVRRSNYDIDTYALVGNHDRETRSITSNHAFAAADIFTQDLANVIIADQLLQFDFDNFDMLMIPSGHKFDHVKIDKPTIIMFHDLIMGSLLANGSRTNRGINPDEIKKLNPIMVLGGDNHRHQRLDDLFGCPSMYVGSTLQHRWDDRLQQKGFWVIQLIKTNWEFKFIQSCAPIFIRLQIEAKTDVETLFDIISKINEYGNNEKIIEVTLIGKYTQNVNQDYLEDNLKQLNVRSIKFIIDKTIERVEIVPGITTTERSEDKWSMYVNNQVNDKDNLDIKMLVDMGHLVINEARNTL